MSSLSDGVVIVSLLILLLLVKCLKKDIDYKIVLQIFIQNVSLLIYIVHEENSV